MKKHKFISYLYIISFVMTMGFGLIFLILLILSLIFPSNKELKIGFSSSIAVLLIYQFCLLKILSNIFSKIGKNKIIFSVNQIETKCYIIDTNEVRVLYTKFSIRNILEWTLPEMVAIINNEEIKIGCFTTREIKKIMHYIPTIKIG